ncbi:MAG TPA: hypothetical protein PKW95_07295 [bacterium]|nr:hypothetical protein [bacterium]
MKKRGKILRIRMGVNPNSSSIGADLQVIIYASAAISMLTVAISALVRLLRRNKQEPKN